jgi:hypothetical protein
MDAISLLARLRGNGHSLWLRNGRLIIAPPPPQRLWPAIREGKEALLVLLTGDHEPPPTSSAPLPPAAGLPTTAPDPKTPPPRRWATGSIGAEIYGKGVHGTDATTGSACGQLRK